MKKIIFIIMIVSVFKFNIYSFADSINFDSRILGEWQIISQSPNQKELMMISMRTMGMKDVNPDDVVIIENPLGKVIFTKDTMWSGGEGKGISGSIEYDIKIEGNKINLIVPEDASGTFANHIKMFTPEYYIWGNV